MLSQNWMTPTNEALDADLVVYPQGHRFVLKIYVLRTLARRRRRLGYLNSELVPECSACNVRHLRWVDSIEEAVHIACNCLPTSIHAQDTL